LRASALSLCVIAGCGPVDSIEHYTVAKPSELAKLTGGDTTPAPKADATKGKPGRMLAAIVLQPAKGWFFKLSGVDKAVAAQQDAFNAFLKSVRFNAAGEPTWTTPDGWQQLPGSGMRYASLKIDTKDEKSAEPLELSVISLGRGDKEDEREYLLSNINRWRGQLQLPPLEVDALDEDTTEVELDAGLIATAVDYTGTLSGNTMGGPFSGMAGPMGGGAMAGPLPGRATPQAPPADKSSRETASGGFVAGEVPDDWNDAGAGGMAAAAFTINSGDQKARLTVTPLAERGNELLPNINRWRGQVGMNEIIADELATHATPIDVGGKPAHYIEMLPEGRDAKQQAILGVVLYDSGKAWFFKMMGDAALVESQRDAFRKFVTTSKIAAP
jgi:hypothetical protein